jgi:hypothetical protein
MEDSKLTIKTLIGLAFADFDIFLLQDESQTKDLDKVHTTEEIRNQLDKSIFKLMNVLTNLGYNVNKPL